MRNLTSDFERPTRRAVRAGKAAGRVARETAKAVAAEHLLYAGRSAKHLKTGRMKAAKHVRALRGAGEEAADIARARLRLALEGLQQASAEMSRWAGARAAERSGQAVALVRRRPAGALLSVLAVGAVLGVVAGLALKNERA